MRLGRKIKHICTQCGITFERCKSDFKKNYTHYYCSLKCYRKHTQRIIISFACEGCGKTVTQDKKNYDRSEHHFCSKSCAVRFNNLHSLKRRNTHKIKLCIKCGEKAVSRRSKYCSNCNPQKRNWSLITLGMMREKYGTNMHNKIRDNAKRVYNKSLKPKKCILCGYKKHYEVCHIKSINSFPDETPLSIINHLDNLIAFCPTHHWEFDNNALDTKHDLKLKPAEQSADNR